MGMVQAFVAKQVVLSRKAERRLPAYCVVDGNRQFQETLVPTRLRLDLVVNDVGGTALPLS